MLSNVDSTLKLRQYREVLQPLFPALPLVGGRGLHSFAFQLNLSAFCGIGVHVGVVEGVYRRCQGV